MPKDAPEATRSAYGRAATAEIQTPAPCASRTVADGFFLATSHKHMDLGVSMGSAVVIAAAFRDTGV